MDQKEMALAITEESGIPLAQVSEIVQRVFDSIIETLVQEGRVELRNFGVFEVKRREPRQARNPRTGEKVWVPERLVATFKAGRELQERVSRGGRLYAR